MAPRTTLECPHEGPSVVPPPGEPASPPNEGAEDQDEDWHVRLTPNTVELIPAFGALSPRSGPIEDPSLPDRSDEDQDEDWHVRLRDWYYIAEQLLHLAHPEGCAAPRIELATVPRGPHRERV